MLNGVLFEGNSVFIVGLQAFLILVSIVYAFSSNFHFRVPQYIKGLNILIILFSIYGFFLIFNTEHLTVKMIGVEVSKTTFLKNIYLSLLPIYAFYYFSKKKQLHIGLMQFWSIVFLVIAVVNFFHYRTYALSIVTGNEITNNAAYGFVGLLPALILFNKKRVFQYLYLAICVVFIVIGMKRGAILASVIGIVWYLLFSFKRTNVKSRWGYVIFAIIVFIVGRFFISYMIETSDYFNLRIAQTVSNDNSGRSGLYSMFYEHFIHETNILRLLFGNGASATLIIGDNYAHNDWLEIAINHGVIGLIVYAYYWVCFFRTWRKSKNYDEAYLAIGMIMIVYFAMSFYSMSYDGMSRGATMVLGYFLANYLYKKEEPDKLID